MGHFGLCIKTEKRKGAAAQNNNIGNNGSHCINEIGYKKKNYKNRQTDACSPPLGRWKCGRDGEKRTAAEKESLRGPCGSGLAVIVVPS